MTKRKHLRHLVRAGIALCVALIVVTAVALDAGYRFEQQKKRACELCKQIEIAIEAYGNSPRSPSTSDETRWPTTLRDLAHPPGGQSLLRNGDADAVDPWGQAFHFEIKTRPDGTVYFLVWTTAPDGTPISQFGIGRNAQPSP